MNNKRETDHRPEIHMMTSFTQETLKQRLLDLAERVRGHKLAMGAAVDKGDEYHDNFAYEEAIRERDLAERMHADVRKKLNDVVIIEPRQEVDVVNVGNDVVVRFAGELTDERFTVLGPDDALQKPGWISYESPLGVLLLGKKPGDQIAYHVPRGEPQQIIVKEVLPGGF